MDLVEEINQLVVAPTEDPEAVVMEVVHHKMVEQETHLLSLQLKEQTEVVEQIPHLIKAQEAVERPLLEPMDLVVQDKAEQEQHHQ